MAAVAATAQILAGGLRETDFRLTADSGFGDGWNHYAHSMSWFRGKIYVGTTRASMAGLKVNNPVPDIRPWPIDSPDDLYAIDRRSEIWEYTPETETWRLAFRAGWIPALFGGGQAPRYAGHRGMTIFKGSDDAEPALYISTWSVQRAGPPDILRTRDGQNFESVPRPPWDVSVRSFRVLEPFGGRVHTSPTAAGAKPGETTDSVGSDATVYASSDVAGGVWAAASEQGFGDPANVTVFEMGCFAGHLYAGTVNATRGFELWKTRGGSLPYRWTKVLERGAWRGPFNQVVGSLCEFNGALYLGSGILNGGFHRASGIGPGAAELIRVWPDDSWELIVGDGRHTPQGLKIPLSGLAAGFDSIFNGYVWRMCVHDGHLYAGTLCWAGLIPYMPIDVWPEDVLAMLQRWGRDTVVRRYGGCELWRSGDGIHWEPVTRSGFGNRFNWGIRTLASTPHGLFVGTANPFGPTLAVQREGRWQYVPNPRGGCEVWLGNSAT